MATLIDTRSLAERTYELLKQQIFAGQLAPGERLNIDSLATEIGVSRTPVRDAVNRLALEGLVVVTPRRGTVVGGLTLEEVEELYGVRALLEPSVCEVVARQASAELIADLERIQHEWEQIDPEAVYHDLALHSRYAELDNQFHLRIVSELGNPRLDQIAQQLNIQRRIAPRLYGSSYRGPRNRMSEHRAILEAIRGGDPAGARRAADRHLQQARRETVAYLRGRTTE
jgi:DNA-binding GntR family transcriptional regulator